MDHTPFFSELSKAIASKGGLVNAHLHLDRAGTLKALAVASGSQSCSEADTSSLSLSSKHRLIPAIHESPEYEPGRLKARVRILFGSNSLGRHPPGSNARRCYRGSSKIERARDVSKSEKLIRRKTGFASWRVLPTGFQGKRARAVGIAVGWSSPGGLHRVLART